ncbi:MAG: SpoIIE family protein phosphatase, partial [Streptomyces sp.]
MPIASFTLDHAAHLTSWSADAAALFGRSTGEVLGRHCRVLLPQSALAALGEAWISAAAGDDYSRVVELTPGDGARRDVLLTCSPLTEASGDTGLLCQVSDMEDATARSESQKAFVDALMRTSPFGLGVLDNALRYVFVNDALAEFNGLPAREHIGRRIGEIVRAADAGEYEKHLREVLETGEPLHNVLISSRSQGRRDRDKVWSVSFFRLTGRDGQVLGLGGLIVDVTQKETALLDASAVRQRLALVNQAGKRVGTTLEMAATARELTEFVVPDFADAVTVEILTDSADDSTLSPADEPLSTLRLAGRSVLDSPAGRALFADFGGEHVHPEGSPSHHTLRTGRAWHSEVLDEEAFAGLVRQEPEAGHLRESDLGSAVMAPLVARGRCFGLVTFGRSTGREPLDEDDRRVAEELAARTALSLDNARLYDEERRIAVALQRNMLPGEKDIPARPGLEIAYHYWSTTRSANVGGDWFDVIPLSGHRIALVVGDMMGHDIHAAAGMGQLRTAMHTLAKLDLEPVDLLTRLDDIVQSSPTMQHATCVYAVYNTVTRGCSIANAGHPAPVLRYRDGRTEMVPVEPGVPLGIGLGSAEFTVVDLVLPENSTLVLYTDGLIERRGEDIDAGIEALRAALAAPKPSGLSMQQWCDDIVGELKEPAADDDLAVLMARASAMPYHRSARWRVPSVPKSVSYARSLVRGTLRDWGLEALTEPA